MTSTRARTVVSALAHLPAVDDETFDFEVREFLRREHCECDELLELSARSEDLTARAYAALLALTWRNRDYGHYRRLVEDAPGELRACPIFMALEAQALSTSSNPRDWQRGLEKANYVVATLPNRPSLMHTQASLAAKLGEQGLLSAAAIEKHLATVDRAIDLRALAPYPKYYATKARLLACLERWADAIAEVDRAIELEPSNGDHYALTIGEYQDIRQAITFRQRAAELNEQHIAALGEMKAIRTQMLELLGLLTAVIAFVITGVGISAKMQRVSDAVAAMGAMASGIVLAFAGFSLLFLPTVRARRAIVLMVLASMAVTGIWAAAKWA